VTGKPPNEEKEGIGELLRRVMLASVGAAAMGMDEIEELIRRARERGEITAADAQKLKDRLSDVLRVSPTAIDEVVERSVQRALRRLNIPGRAEIDRLHRMIEALVKKIESLEED
jgi:polyhydroxyalkanoate synthesis regulator phasin